MKNSSSLLPELLQSFPELRAQVYFKATLTAISHAMEDLVLAGTEQPLVIANFQQERYYRQEAGRYQRIADLTDRVYVLAAPETDFASAPASFATIGLEQTDELAQEWHLAIVGENYSACLICREHAAPVGTIDLDSARQFRGFWTFDPVVSRQAAALLLQRIGDYRPDLASQIDREKQRGIIENPPSQSAESLSAELFVNRLVTYLQASQNQQVKAYQRVVEQERQERLVNRFTAAIRQAVTIEDILAVTIREISQLFQQCRCLLSRSPELAESEYLASHPHFQPLLYQGQIISIADISQDSGIQSHPDLQVRLAQLQIEACLLVPIFVGAAGQSQYRQQCLGVLELHNSSPYLWSIADRDLLRSIAERVGIELLQIEAFHNLQQMNQQLSSLKQAQNNLIAIVGHELRTPLSTIQICLESLDAEPDMPAKYQQSMVEIALTDSERLRKLVEDFLLLSRLDSNLTTWQMESINLADSLSIAVSHLQAASQPRELPTIVMDLALTLPPIIADNEALFQLLSKLLDNACKFTPPTGTITLKISEVTTPTPAAQMSPQPMLEVEIADTGCGIEPDLLETIFERFHQEEGFLRRAVGGAGLGLSICRQLVRQLGGQIWATSQGKGQGSQFYVTLPVLVN
jgi:DICT domain-containing protein/nitrogen-specific signal transduction histidine kinase